MCKVFWVVSTNSSLVNVFLYCSNLQPWSKTKAHRMIQEEFPKLVISYTTTASNSNLLFANSKMDYQPSDSLLAKVSETIQSIQGLEITHNLHETLIIDPSNRNPTEHTAKSIWILHIFNLENSHIKPKPSTAEEIIYLLL